MLKEYLLSLADAFRSKLGITGKINAQSFSDKVNEVYDKGKYDEWSDFWDAFQENGARRNYDYAFRGKWWNDETFKPKYDLIIDHGVGCFTFRNCAITDLEAILKKQNVNLTFWGGNCSECFNSSTITVMPELDVSEITSFYLFFAWCSKLHTIRKLTFKESQIISTGMFDGCTALTNLEIGGVIGNDFRIASSPLSKESIESIVNHLSDSVADKTATFKKTAVNNAFGINVDDETTYTEEWKTLRNSKTNWTFAYA